jgi:ACS family glucarate transporter-like MFS transporter
VKSSASAEHEKRTGLRTLFTDRWTMQLMALAGGANLLGYLDRVSISIVAPSLQRELGFSTTDLGLVFGAFSLSYALFQIPWGILADRSEVRSLVVGVVLLWSLFTGLTAIASGLILFIAIRFFFGFSEAALSPIFAAEIRRNVPQIQRSAAFGIFLGAGRVGAMIAPPATAFLVVRFGWRFAFLALAALGLVFAATWALLHRRSTQPLRPQRTSLEWRSFFSRPVLALVFVAFLYSTVWQFFVTWFPTYLIVSRHFSLQRASFYAMQPFLFGLLATVFGGALATWSTRSFGIVAGRRLIVMTGFSLSGTLLWISPRVTAPVLGVLMLTMAAGVGDLALSTLWASAVELQEGSGGAVAGYMNAAANVGAFLSPVSIGAMLKFGGSWTAILSIGAGLNALAALLWILTRSGNHTEQHAL